MKISPTDATNRQLQRLQKSVKEGGDTLAKAVKQVTLEAAEEMVHAISGEDVSWAGGSFKINVRTGNLRRRTRIEYPFGGDPYTGFVHNDAEYAPNLILGMSGQAKKEALLSGPGAKVSKAGRKYQRIPGGPGSLVPFWTVTEDSTLRDQPPRPFVEATADRMKERAKTLLGEAIMKVLSVEK